MTKPITCSECPLYRKGRGFVLPAPPADWSLIKLVVIGEAPGTNEADEGLPFVGKAGHWLRHNVLANVGLQEGETWFDNTIRCQPPMGKNGEHYPVGQERIDAESCCSQYSIYNSIPSNVAILYAGAKAVSRGMSLPNVGNWHGHIDLVGGRIRGCTFHPSAVMRQPNLLPVVIKEISNLIDAAKSPLSILVRPTVAKGRILPKSDQPRVFDLEWSPKGEITVVGMAESGSYSTSTFDVEAALEAVKGHGGTLIGHNIIDADLVRMNWTPKDWKPETIFDSKLASHLVHAHLAELGLFDLGSMMRYYEATTNWKENTEDVLHYNGLDCAYNFRLYQFLAADLMATEQWHLMEKQQRLSRMAVLMRQRGIRVDSDAIRTFAENWHTRREALAASFPFNPNSSPQVIKWAQQEKISLANTQYDTIAKVADRHAILKQLLEYKDEGKSIKVWFNDEALEMGFIHPTFNVTGTAVARFSCSEPNCQNIPPYLRHIIIADNCDTELVSFDFNQIENRCIAYLANDKQMLADFDSGVDFHKLSASRIFNKAITDVTPDERQQGKVTIHATNYLETAYHLADRLYGSRTATAIAQARKLQTAYFAAYPAIGDWHQRTSRQLDSGDVMLRNPFGRVRFVYAQNSHERAKRGCHYLGCSTAADIVNGRVLDVWEQTGLLPLLIVHDEAVYSLPKGDSANHAKIREILEQPVGEMGELRLKVKMKAGSNYGTML